MKFNALVMSRSTSTAKILVSAFAELGMESRISTSPSETMELVATEYHSALMLDFDLPPALEVAKMARSHSAKRRPVLFGMIGSKTSIGGVFEAGANFVLYKPLDLLQVLHSLRAGQGFMRQDRRRAARRKSETLAYLQLPSGTIPALVLEVTEEGLSLEAAAPLLPIEGVPLRLLIPGTTQMVAAMADFRWADAGGRAGLLFSAMPAASRRQLDGWLGKRGSRRSQMLRMVHDPRAARPDWSDAG
jgi:DNA-binding response OmpR family regulator